MSGGYLAGDEKISYDLVKKSYYHFSGTSISYGLFSKLTVEGEWGYFINKSQEYPEEMGGLYSGFGLSDAVLSLKYNLINSTSSFFEWTIGSGIKIPSRRTYQKAGHIELPRDVQPSTRSYGVVLQSFLSKKIPEKNMHLFFIQRYEFHYPDLRGFRHGNLLNHSLFLSKQFEENRWNLMLQIRYEMRGKDRAPVKKHENCCPVPCSGTASGGHVVFAGPVVNIGITPKWWMGCMAEFPIYQNYRGIQLGNRYAFAITITGMIGKECMASER